MNCPLCNCQMQEFKWDQPPQYGPRQKFEFYCKNHGDYQKHGEGYYIRDSINSRGTWHQIITPIFAFNWFEQEKKISIYRANQYLIIKEENKSLNDFINLYHRLNNLKAFL